MEAYKFNEITYKSEQLKALIDAGFDLKSIYTITKLYGTEVRRDGRGMGKLWYSHPFHFIYNGCNGVGGCRQVVSFFCPPFASADVKKGWVLKKYPAGVDPDVKKMEILDAALFGKRLGSV